jgi:hypothetical protein
VRGAQRRLRTPTAVQCVWLLAVPDSGLSLAVQWGRNRRVSKGSTPTPSAWSLQLTGQKARRRDRISVSRVRKNVRCSKEAQQQHHHLTSHRDPIGGPGRGRMMGLYSGTAYLSHQLRHRRRVLFYSTVYLSRRSGHWAVNGLNK